MYTITNKATGAMFGEYSDRKTADKAIREHLIRHNWDKNTYEIRRDGSLVARVQQR